MQITLSLILTIQTIIRKYMIHYFRDINYGDFDFTDVSLMDAKKKKH